MVLRQPHRRRRKLARIGGALDPAAAAVLAAFPSPAGTVWKAEVNRLLSALRRRGILQKLDSFSIHGGEAAANGVLNWITAADEYTPMNSPGWSALGYAGNGSNAEVSLGFTDTDFALTGATMGVYSSWGAGVNAFAFGEDATSGFGNTFLTPNNGSGAMRARFRTSNTIGLALAGLVGAVTMARDASEMAVYGPDGSQNDSAAPSNSTQTQVMALLRWRDSYAPATTRVFAHWGAFGARLTQPEIAALHAELGITYAVAGAL